MLGMRKLELLIVVLVLTLIGTASPAHAAFQQGDTPVIEALINTSCRSGPGAAFERTGFLLKGQQAEPLGVDSTGTWWYIGPPRGIGRNCWVSSGTTRVVSGEVDELETLTEGFDSVAADRVIRRFFRGVGAGSTTTGAGTSGAGTSGAGTGDSSLLSVNDTVDAVVLTACGNQTVAYFGVRNRGTYALESARLTVFDETAGQTLFGPISGNLPFLPGSLGCQTGFSRLEPGRAAYVGATLAGMPVRGHFLQATILLCSRDGLSGTCEQRVVEFTAP